MSSFDPTSIGSVFFPDSADVAGDLGTAQKSSTIAFGGAEAHHASVVKRLGVGERISIGDGCGQLVTGDVVASSKQRVEIEIVHTQYAAQRTPQLVLVQALAKGGRDEMAVQAATELGVDVVIPWAAEHSIARWKGDKVSRGRDKWQNIARGAAKQSLRAYIPEVLPMATSVQLGAAIAAGGVWFVADPRGEESLSAGLAKVSAQGLTQVGIVIGPEGGISATERDSLQAAGASIVQMGTNVLRTSTAGPTALTIIQTQLGLW